MRLRQRCFIAAKRQDAASRSSRKPPSASFHGKPQDVGDRCRSCILSAHKTAICMEATRRTRREDAEPTLPGKGQGRGEGRGHLQCESAGLRAWAISHHRHDKSKTSLIREPKSALPRCLFEIRKRNFQNVKIRKSKIRNFFNSGLPVRCKWPIARVERHQPCICQRSFCRRGHERLRLCI